MHSCRHEFHPDLFRKVAVAAAVQVGDTFSNEARCLGVVEDIGGFSMGMECISLIALIIRAYLASRIPELFSRFCKRIANIDYSLILSNFLSLFHKLRNFISTFSGFYMPQITEFQY